MQEAKKYKGIDFVRLRTLPVEEQNQIKNWITPDSIIKIQTDSELMKDCIMYKDYQHWYNHVFSKITLAEEEEVEVKYKTTRKKLFGWAFDQN